MILPALRCSAVLAAALLLLAPAGARAQGGDGQTNPELAGIAEEQDLLMRQLGTLQTTMENLLERIEAEGRTHTAELLREGLALLAAAAADSGLTVERRMGLVKEAIDEGRLVASLEHQDRLVAELERLLDILHDRENLEGLQDRISTLRALRAELDLLAGEEGTLRKNTAALREAATSEEERALAAGLREMIERQRALLAETEREGRASGALELEQLGETLDELIAAQRADHGVLSLWEPAEAAELHAGGEAVERARAAEARGARLAEAAAAVRQAAA
ncbi:MAG: hypothetical protein AB1726_10495, partial [Planctomycetota bacterium]